MGVLRNNRPLFLFLIKFAGSYLLLSVLYWAYLSRYDAEAFEPDGMTTLVAEQASAFVNLIGEESHIKKHPGQAAWMFYVNDKRVARIVEGCNAVSVIALFAAFIIAFSTTFRRTSLYILMGIALLHILNIIRVGLLGVGLYYYKEKGPLLHDIIFPLFIYGVVVVLWVAWVMKLSVIKVKNVNALLGAFGLFVLLVLVRFYEETLFYDPLLPFFKREGKELPDYDSLKLFLGLAFRYGLNTLLSLGVIWLAFKDKAIIRLAAILYGVLFAVLCTVLFIGLNAEKPNLLLIFYVRRFLIQPLLLLLLLPAFFYQKRMK
ncbi:exosortase family protein XrtF [Flavobacterium sp. MFBS3-15]|uniref:exosortase family protein XrtF n=1 Tax=Flavobacterium sp. MFBS3-15 TaxID=2989816 RepID=UPI002236064E|nr:exosortase family protein XrtF [Flavobacterium sp. MFBS3-15]MCW4469479.1 exosortase family protein XrtF [Flavobacterium sp. MFBS3-15]